MIKKILFSNLFLCLFLSISCSIEEESFQSMAPENDLQASDYSISTITPLAFDWENADYMPTPEGVTIMSPWAVGANQSFPPEFISDRNHSDGWELVYNTFNYENLSSPSFFIIYNKYRGLLRGFFYLSPTTPVPSNYVTHDLKLKNNTASPLLNYSSAEIYDMTVNEKVTSKVQPFKTTATGTWYASEFDIAYDPNISNFNAENNLLEWAVNSVNITEIQLNGHSEGTIEGTMTQPSSSPNLFNSVLKGAISFGALTAIDAASNIIDGAIAESAKSSIQSAGNREIKNSFNSIFGFGSGGGLQYVNLKTSTDHEFTGSMQNNSVIASPSLVIPGTAGQTEVSGYEPLYTNPLGIISFTGKPIVHGHYKITEVEAQDDRDGRRGTIVDWFQPSNFYLDTDSYSFSFNSSVINNSPNGAHIENLKTEIVGFEQGEKSDNKRFNINPTEKINGKDAYVISLDDEITQQVGGYTEAGYNGPPSAAIIYDDYQQEMEYEFLRISFDVVPNNGASEVSIVKTFKLFCEATIDDRR